MWIFLEYPYSIYLGGLYIRSRSSFSSQNSYVHYGMLMRSTYACLYSSIRHPAFSASTVALAKDHSLRVHSTTPDLFWTVLPAQTTISGASQAHVGIKLPELAGRNHTEWINRIPDCCALDSAAPSDAGEPLTTEPRNQQ